MLLSTALLISVLFTVGDAAGGVKGGIKSPSFEPQVKIKSPSFRQREVTEDALGPSRVPDEDFFEEEEEEIEEASPGFPESPREEEGLSRPFIPAPAPRPAFVPSVAAPRPTFVPSSIPNFIEPPQAPRPEPIAEVLANYRPPTPYSFGYNAALEDGSSSGRREVSTGDRVEGTYELSSADGRRRTVHYVADQDGFRAFVDTNEPGTFSGAPAGVLMKSDQLSGSELAKQNEPFRVKTEGILSPGFVPSKTFAQPQKIQTWRAPRTEQVFQTEVKAPSFGGLKSVPVQRQVKAPVVWNSAVPVSTWKAEIKAPSFPSVAGGLKSVPVKTWSAPQRVVIKSVPIQTWTAPVKTAPVSWKSEVKAPSFGGFKSVPVQREVKSVSFGAIKSAPVSWKAEVKAPSFGGLKSVPVQAAVKAPSFGGLKSAPVSWKSEVKAPSFGGLKSVPVQREVKSVSFGAIKSAPVSWKTEIKAPSFGGLKSVPVQAEVKAPSFSGLKTRTISRPSKIQTPVFRAKTVTGNWARPTSFKVEIPQHNVQEQFVRVEQEQPRWEVKSLPVIKPAPLKTRLIALAKHSPVNNNFAGFKGLRAFPEKTVQQQPAAFKASFESKSVEQKLDAPQLTQEKL